MDVAQFLKGAGDRRPTKTVYLSPDPDALSAADVAARAREGGSLADPPEDVAEARREALSSAWQFAVSTIPAAQWKELLSQHPPSDAQVKEGRREGQIVRFDPETFPLAATAACLVKATNPDGGVLTFDPPRWDGDGNLAVDSSAAELVKMSWDTFPLGETNRLWTTVLGLNVAAEDSGKVQSFANGSTQTRSGGR